MLQKIITLLVLLSVGVFAGEKNMASIYDIEIITIDGEKRTMVDYKDKVILVVNVASKCGFTPQYDGLEALFDKYKDKGLVILGFPSNQFGSQEPGTNDEIANFCRVSFGVSFPMFEKIEVNGDNTHPLYVYLKSQKSGFLGSESIKWNFTKFLVNKDGKVVDRYAPSTKPKSLEDAIEALL
jgi:glutathione peroxidase